jgi:hypothetical protein
MSKRRLQRQRRSARQRSARQRSGKRKRRSNRQQHTTPTRRFPHAVQYSQWARYRLSTVAEPQRTRLTCSCAPLTVLLQWLSRVSCNGRRCNGRRCNGRRCNGWRAPPADRSTQSFRSGARRGGSKAHARGRCTEDQARGDRRAAPLNRSIITKPANSRSHRSASNEYGKPPHSTSASAGHAD